MKNINIIFAFVLILGMCSNGFAQYDQDRYDFDKWEQLEYCLDYDVHDEIIQLTDSILNVLGLERNFEFLYCPDLKNACAVILPSREYPFIQKRYIVYDFEFLQELKRKSGSELAILVVLIHEVGHHLNGDPLNDHDQDPKIELKADKFVGNTIAFLGGSLPDVLNVYLEMPDPYYLETHPFRRHRLIAIEQGWKNYWEKYNPELMPETDLKKAQTAFQSGLNNMVLAERIEHFTLAISYDISFTEAYLERGQALMEDEQFELAESDFLEVLKERPQDVDAISGLAWAHYKQGYQDEAHSILDTTSVNLELASTSYFIKGKISFEKGDTILAERYFSKAILSNPDCEVDRYFERAVVRQHLNQDGNAIDDLNKVILREPNFWLAYMSKGKSLMVLGKPKEALDNFQVAYDLRNGDNKYEEDLCLLLASACLVLGLHEDGLMYLSKTYKRSEAKYILQARLNSAMGEYLYALDACRRALKLSPGNVEALEVLKEVVEQMSN